MELTLPQKRLENLRRNQLDERVGVLDLVRVLGGVSVNHFHSVTLWSSFDSHLSVVDIVVHSVESSDDDHGWNSLEHGLEVIDLVDHSRTLLVLVEVTHSPSERSFFEAKSGVEFLISFGL